MSVTELTNWLIWLPIGTAIDNVALPRSQFPAFLTKAEQLLKSLRFPRTGG